MSRERRRLLLAVCFVLGSVGWLWYAYQHPWQRWRHPLPKTHFKPFPAQDVSALKAPPRIAFVIDDVCYVSEPMDRFAELGIPFTFALLPRHKTTRPLAEKAFNLGFPVMLHIPMEPLDVLHNDPGPAGLYLRMTEAELKKQFDQNLNSVPHAVGINNHMGSAFTENAEKMRLVLEWTKNRGVYFMDSRTSTKSVVCREAKRLNLPCMDNETFLDNEDSVEGIKHQLGIAMMQAQKHGQTIAIGHYRRKFIIQAFREMLPEFKARGIEIVKLPSFYSHEYSRH